MDAAVTKTKSTMLFIARFLGFTSAIEQHVTGQALVDEKRKMRSTIEPETRGS